MAITRKILGLWMFAGPLVMAAAFLPALRQVYAGSSLPSAPQQANVRELASRFPEKPSIAPLWSIPVEPLGFAAPGPNYAGMRNAMVSLDFLGEDRLLFTFRVPGLMRREPGSTSEDQRQIRAVVLSLPSGTIQSETNWTVHDRLRYLWALDDDHFLLRDRDIIYEGDAKLDRRPLLLFPGQLISIGINPGRQYIVTNSDEPVNTTSTNVGGQVPAISSSGDDFSRDNTSQPEFVLRILRSDSHQVRLVTRIRTPVEVPINNDGYLSPLRGSGAEWMVALNFFTGETRILGKVKSACTPASEFLSENEALITACSDSGGNALVAMTTAGTTLWTDLVSDRLVWPLIATSRNGLRFAREALYVSHSVNAFDPMASDDIRGQLVRLIDSATGNVAFESPAAPIFDAGGNVAISPSGRRVAVLNAGAIQVFELPAPPGLPTSDAQRPPH